MEIDGSVAPIHIGEVTLLCFIAYFIDFGRSRTRKASFLCKKVGFLKIGISKVLQNMQESLNFDVFGSINVSSKLKNKRKTLSKTKTVRYVSKKCGQTENLIPRSNNRRFGSANPYRRGHFALFYCIIHRFLTFMERKTYIFMQFSWFFDVHGTENLHFYAVFLVF